MTSTLFTWIFLALLTLNVGLKYWLASRQIHHVLRRADAVPEQFAPYVSLEAHRKAAAYTVAKQRMAMIETACSAIVLLLLTLCGGLQALSDLLGAWLGYGMAFQLAVASSVVLIVTLVDLPIEWYRQFRVEQQFGFNRMTPGLFVADTAKSIGLSAAIGLPLLALVLTLMRFAGSYWWVYAWLIWCGFTLLLTVLFPIWIAPLFNRFTPLSDSELLRRIQALLGRAGFQASGVYTMDGSRRSSHGNAYFTGLGAAKRIVFFDTLLQRLQPTEIEAVLAHELGHFRLRHVRKRLLLGFVASGLLLAALSWLMQRAWFYQGLGVEPLLQARNDGLALVLFFLVVPVFTFLFAPVSSLLSRRQEFEADAFAARYASPRALIDALIKLYKDNATTLTPDPVHSTFYNSHPPASIRIERLLKLGSPAAAA
ncbi:MAG TPA: M48 family metallopeptidase [Burkholderiaceae bacterium]|jgi:STE24 endopeptidase|nr:M48 family metallopeptidase [Burkholderiaceae bacterium]